MSAALPPKEGEENVAYLEIPESQRVAVPETVWAKIGDNNELEVLRWDLINVYAAQYDADKNTRTQTHVMCKLLTLVRDQVRKEMARE